MINFCTAKDTIMKVNDEWHESEITIRMGGKKLIFYPIRDLHPEYIIFSDMMKCPKIDCSNKSQLCKYTKKYWIVL